MKHPYYHAAQNLASQLVAWRRDFHRHPELSFQEKETARKASHILASLGLEVRTGVGGTGVVGLLRGQRSEVAVALRADMDALPLQEATGREFASLNPGIMHACGHDAHMAMVLGAAAILAQERDRLPGSVKFIFQPGEEKPPGGAKLMIEEGVLEDPPVKAIYGLHVNSQFPPGTVAVKEGPVMAAVDNFTLRIRGQGGHGSSPHLGIDAIVVACELVLALQTIISRASDPLQPAVLTVGTIKGGEKENIIASEVELSGTVRTLDSALRAGIKERFKQVVTGVTSAHGATYELEYLAGYPVLYNDSRLLKVLRSLDLKALGIDELCWLPVPSMGGEDFAWYAQKVPGLYLFLGAKPPSGQAYNWHHPSFDIHEGVLPLGAALLAALAAETLRLNP
ncbi:amidohydrolase [Moorellaceae bacterium AZ2]